MDPIKIANESANELVNAQTHVWNHILSYLNSVALKCAIELGIPDAIQKHGKPMTAEELAISLSLHPNKAPFLNRLMRLLFHSDFFSIRVLSNGEEVFDLTINSRVLLKDHPLTLTPLALMMVDLALIEPAQHFSSWFKSDDVTSFHSFHKKSFWEYAACVPKFNKHFDEAMTSDSQFVASLLVNNNEFKGLLEGIESLVDVGGGSGTMAKAISKLFPELSCVVYDQPYVIQGLKEDGKNIKYVGGDMFEAIPPAQVVLLKWILHDWSDDDCVKILQRCKEAIPSKNEGGKIIIIEMVVKINHENVNYSNSQLLIDVLMLLHLEGKERTEDQWKSLFKSAGLGEYKIFSMLGPRSVIEVYPLQ